MSRTPGFVVPSSYSSPEALEEDLQRRAKTAGFTPFSFSDFGSDVTHTDNSKESVVMSTEVDNYLEHYGVKGMRWGKRSSSSGSSSSKSDARKNLREINKKAKVEIKAEKKADREKFKKEWDDEVLGARERLGKEGEKLSEARKKYKADKKVIGKAAAKKVFKEQENKFIDTFNVASLNTHKEAQQQMIAAVGLMTLAAVVGGVSEAMR